MQKIIPNMLSIRAFMIFILFVSVSCTSISYIPTVTLDVSPVTINKSLQIDKFDNLTPESDHKNPFSGIAATNPDALSGALDLQVPNAITWDFSNNQVFLDVKRNLDNPDYVMKGEILRFRGKYRPSTFNYVISVVGGVGLGMFNATEEPAYLILAVPALLQFAGLPVQKLYTEIELRVHIFDRDGQKINTYTGKASDSTYRNIYTNVAFTVPSHTNKSFNKVVQQIRDQVIADVHLYQ
ncbi:MAG TPA: hypothetical protein PKC30_00160 [Saprospiraceae bacterium]|nr:hypothetical protein [Saprospiraceae bacterium]